MKKSDLKTGMIAETNNGTLYAVLLNPYTSNDNIINITNIIMVSSDGWIDLNDYNEDLVYLYTDDINDGLSIKCVYSNIFGCGIFNRDGMTLIWERKNLDDDFEAIPYCETMTIKQIENKLGYKIKLVSE